MADTLVRRGVRLVAVEPDPVCCRNLRKRFGREPKIRIIESDFLTIATPGNPSGSRFAAVR